MMNATLKKIVFTFIPNSSWRRDDELTKLLTGCESLLDVGCGKGESFGDLKLPAVRKDGVELDHSQVEAARQSGRYTNVWERDVRNISFIPDNSYDAVICINLIEHLPKKDGIPLLKEMERIARKIVVLETPSGYMGSNEHDVKENMLQKHLSGWTQHNFEERGYSVMGIFGHKWVKNTRLLKHLTDKLVRRFPSSAFMLMVSKRMNDG